MLFGWSWEWRALNHWRSERERERKAEDRKDTYFHREFFKLSLILLLSLVWKEKKDEFFFSQTLMALSWYSFCLYCTVVEETFVLFFRVLFFLVYFLYFLVRVFFQLVWLVVFVWYISRTQHELVILSLFFLSLSLYVPNPFSAGCIVSLLCS